MCAHGGVLHGPWAPGGQCEKALWCPGTPAPTAAVLSLLLGAREQSPVLSTAWAPALRGCECCQELFCPLILSFGESLLGQAFNLRLERMLLVNGAPGRSRVSSDRFEPRALCCRCRYLAASALASIFPPGECSLRTDEGVVDEAGGEGRRLCAG